MSGGHAVLVGATASGKSALALELARRDSSWELVTVDSMQVYRGMDIGTAKPTPAERAEVPHHLLDLLQPWEEATVAWFQREAQAAVAAIEARGHRALLVGGTALYVQAVVDDLDIPGRFAEVRAILEEAVGEPDDAPDLFETLLKRFGAAGGVELDLPPRDQPVRIPELPL